ncbi:MAG TPA: DUF1573 domain-containing protein [Pirellulales bacterium]|nr:DUF1573 domain-containing protein [Pirellulales bacterium]
MVRTLLCTMLLVLATHSAASAQEWARKMFEETKHDFGAVARGAKAEFRFELKNIYLEDVHIASVRSSCGCTSPTIEHELLKTYQRGAILATFNTRAFNGQKSATVTVTFDKPFYAEVQLQVSGFIRSDVVLSPGGAEFGTIDAGAEAAKKITIAYEGRSDWAITEIKSGSPYVEAIAEETSRIGSRISYELTVMITPDAPPGYVKEQLVIVTNDRGGGAEFPVDVEARVVSELTISPASLFLGALKPGQKVTKQIIVQAKRPFHITSVSCEDDCFEFETPRTAKAVQLVPVVFTAGDEPGKLSYKIKIRTDLDRESVSELSAFAQVLDESQADTDESADGQQAQPLTEPNSDG